MLAYVPKRHAYQYVTYTSLMYLYAIFRNQAYQARIQLAVLDNNAHCLREPAHSRDGTAIHARKFRKPSKKWDVTPVKKSKEYSYVNKIIQEIQKQRYDSCESLKKKRPLSPSNPYHIQHTIGDSDPPSTSMIIENNRSRLLDVSLFALVNHNEIIGSTQVIMSTISKSKINTIGGWVLISYCPNNTGRNYFPITPAQISALPHCPLPVPSPPVAGGTVVW